MKKNSTGWNHWRLVACFLAGLQPALFGCLPLKFPRSHVSMTSPWCLKPQIQLLVSLRRGSAQLDDRLSFDAVRKSLKVKVIGVGSFHRCLTRLNAGDMAQLVSWVGLDFSLLKCSSPPHKTLFPHSLSTTMYQGHSKDSFSYLASLQVSWGVVSHITTILCPPVPEFQPPEIYNPVNNPKDA